MRYHQLTPEDRYTLAAYRKQVPRLSAAEIGRRMGRDRSTISRELRRNCCAHDGGYRAGRAQEQAHARRKRSRRNSHFGPEEWKLVEMLLKEKCSREQISGRLRALGLFEISHETIYSYVWRDKKRGGTLYRYLRQPFKRRKRYGSYERRGRATGKRHISERPTAVEDRSEIGHWEIDTVIGTPDGHCVASLVERVIGVVLIGKLRRRNVAALNKRVIEFIKEHPGLFLSITARRRRGPRKFRGAPLRERVRRAKFGVADWSIVSSVCDYSSLRFTFDLDFVATACGRFTMSNLMRGFGSTNCSRCRLWASSIQNGALFPTTPRCSCSTSSSWTERQSNVSARNIHGWVRGQN